MLPLPPQIKTTQYALVTQLVEVHVSEACQCEFESHLRHKVFGF